MRNGLATLPSPFDAEETFSRLVAAVAARGLTVFSQIDHAHAAKLAGLQMRFAHLLIFGSAKAGTLLMQLAPTLAIDLPLKALVWEDEQGATWLSYNEPGWFARRHGLVAPDAADLAWETEGGAVVVGSPGSWETEQPSDQLFAAVGPRISDMAKLLSELAHAVVGPPRAR